MIVPLAEAVDTDVYGGKAVQLGTALRDGLPVPDGYALSPDLVDAVAAADAAAISSLDLCERLGPRAVRSSALDEDSEGASFAGAHLSVLGVCGHAATVSAVRAVHASGQHASAQGYRMRLGLRESAQMAVVIQSLVDSDVAGVLFTRNPVTGADERVIEATWGLGEAVVAGLVTPDSYRVARGGRELERTMGEKDIAVRRRASAGAGEPTEEVPVSPDLIDVFCLEDRHLKALDELASICDEVYGSTEHDIEFAFRGDDIFLLQRRPITSA